VLVGYQSQISQVSSSQILAMSFISSIFSSLLFISVSLYEIRSSLLVLQHSRLYLKKLFPEQELSLSHKLSFQELSQYKLFQLLFSFQI